MAQPLTTRRPAARVVPALFVPGLPEDHERGAESERVGYTERSGMRQPPG